METTAAETSRRSHKVAWWVGLVITILMGAVFIFLAAMKFRGGPEVEEGMTASGIPVSLVTTIAILEMTCAVIYLVPATSVLGAVLLTGYMGGAIMTHLRVEENVVAQIIIGVLVWLGIYLREPRLWRLLPVRLGR